MLWLHSIKDQATSAGKSEYGKQEVKFLIQYRLSQIFRCNQTFYYPEIGSP